MSAEPGTRIPASLAGIGLFAGALILLLWWDPVTPADATAASDWFNAAQLERGEEVGGSLRTAGLILLGLRIALLAAVGFTALGPALARRIRGPRWWRTLVLVAGIEALVLVLGLPIRLYARGVRLDAGLTNQSVPDWLRDLGVSAGLSVLLLALPLMVLLWLAGRMPRWWPAVAAAGGAALVAAMSFAWPVVIEPAFNDFEPLAAGELRSDLLQLADWMDVEVGDVVVADASRRTTTFNAWVSGLGPTRRIVLYDNLVGDGEAAQVRAVVAHELAHAAHRDVAVGTAVGAAGVFVGVGLLALLARRTGRRLDRAEAVPWLVATIAVLSLLAAPAENAISRGMEAAADEAAIAATGDPGAFVRMQRSLALRSAADLTPPGWYHWWFGSHPTTLQRIAMAQQH